MEKALDNLRVLETTHVWAGPIVGMMMADMGAEVIHVEKPGHGDMQRHPSMHGPGIEGENLVFAMLNRNKKSITLNLKAPKGKEMFMELVKQSDIVVENFTPGTMDSLGIGYDDLSAVNPRIIMVSVSGFGQNGPYRDYHAYDLVAQAMSGWMSVTGYPGQPPVRGGGVIADYLGGIFGFCGLMTALYWRERSGQGQQVDVSLMDSAAFTLGDRIVRYAAIGDPELIAPVGNKYPNMPMALCYPTKDGYFTFRFPSTESIGNLIKMIDEKMPANMDQKQLTVKEMTENPGFWESYEDRITQFLKDKTNDEAMAIMESMDIACSPVLTLDKVIEDPQFNAREMMVEVEHPKIGKMKMPGIVPKLSKTPGKVETPGPSLGQHNEDIYCSLLGCTKDELANLKDDNII